MKKFTATILVIIMVIIQVTIHVSASDSAVSAGKVTTESTALNVRSQPSSSSSVIGSLKRNSYVMLISKSGQWWLVEYSDGKTGYCHSDYITQLSAQPKYTTVSSGYLNVRTGAGTSYSAKDKLYNGEKVFILSESGNWALVLFDGNETGYVNTSYLKSGSSSADRLSVPYFSQTDSRWSGVYLGSSGQTLGRIGCTTTCLAMTESFRTGTTIRPDTMAGRLTYSSSGSLYWPSNYRTTTSVSYSSIRSILDQGKPVILGLRTASYNTHWVVVTGYSGDTYYVNDPGASSRTTLGQVLAKYPYFYKLAYYV